MVINQSDSHFLQFQFRAKFAIIALSDKNGEVIGLSRHEIKMFRKNSELFLLALPGLLLLFVFCYLPIPGLVLAFKKFNYALGLWGSKWAGFDNFRFFFSSQDAYRITRNTILYNFTFMILTTLIAVALAILLKEVGRRWMRVHQTVLFLPYFLSWVVIAYVALSLFDYGDGIIHANGYVNKVLEMLGFEPVRWYYEGQYWPYIITLFQLWKHIGFTTLIYFAGLIGIDPTYYEAAEMDGASKWQKTRTITVPLLMPLIVILLILDIGKIFRSDFGLFYFVPNNSSLLYPATDVIDTYVFRSLLGLGDIGMSTAIGFYQSAVGFLLVVGSNYVIRRIDEEKSLW